MIHLKSPAELEAMAKAGSIIPRLHQELRNVIQPGVSTQAIDEFVEEFVTSHEGAIPSFKGLYGFPASACISVNEEVVHGIPKSEVVLASGDIVTVDVGVKLDGWHGDSAFTFPVGEVTGQAALLMDVTRNALDAAVAAAQVGNTVGDIGAAVMAVAAPGKHGVIRDLVGHGIGRELHEEPQVPNVGRAGSGHVLKAGMVLAIEPMIAVGTDRIRTLADRWTVVTADGSLSAHFEHTVAVTAEGPRLLTGGGIWEDTPSSTGTPVGSSA